MGLDFRPGKASWSYGGFHRFRVRLAREIDIDLNQMEGFFRPWAGQLEEDFVGYSWESVIDPIKYLLNHSDCDGILIPWECSVVAPRLRELVVEWEDGYDKTNALMLADAMDQCVKEGIDLEFW